MEPVLPDKYREAGLVVAQREMHSSLISKGLKLISDSYLQKFALKCQEAGLEFRGKSAEGKNFQVVLEESEKEDYDLLVLGLHGLGKVDERSTNPPCWSPAATGPTVLL